MKNYRVSVANPKRGKSVNIVPSEAEMTVLEAECAEFQLTKTIVIRQLLRELGEKRAARLGLNSLMS